jgi:hypothetical protein
VVSELTRSHPQFQETLAGGAERHDVGHGDGGAQCAGIGGDDRLFGGGYGTGGSGGLYVEVVKPATVYMQVNYDRLPALQLGFDAKLPAGSRLEFYLMPILPKEWSKRAWPGRLPLGEVVCTGEFKTYALTPANAVAAENFLKLIQEHGLNHGATEFKVTLGFKLLPLAKWTVGSSLQLDNLRLDQRGPAR